MAEPRAPSAEGWWTGLRLASPGLAQLSAQDAGSRPASEELGLVVEAGRIAWIGPAGAIPAGLRRGNHHDGGGALLTPGLIDCHTHFVYAGQRAAEFTARLAGASYAELAAAGGGILATVRATRAASEDGLFEAASRRLAPWLDEGVCAIEIKSGYGLSLEHERRQLRAARRLGEVHGITVRTTFLGAHALPPEFLGRSDDYITQVCREMLPALAEEGLVDAVDVFCEHLAFSLEQTARVFEAATGLGLPVKIHTGQLSDLHGAELAARHQALSCDHLEHVSASGIAAMQAAGTVAVLLPGAWYSLRDSCLPPVAALRAAGVPMALATDHNPGTSPLSSLLLAMNMACTLFGLSVTEALEGVTCHAARALGLQDSHGLLASGRSADFVLWPFEDAAELVYGIGQRPDCTVVRQGRLTRQGRR